MVTRKYATVLVDLEDDCQRRENLDIKDGNNNVANKGFKFN